MPELGRLRQKAWCEVGASLAYKVKRKSSVNSIVKLSLKKTKKPKQQQKKHKERIKEE